MEVIVELTAIDVVLAASAIDHVDGGDWRQ